MLGGNRKRLPNAFCYWKLSSMYYIGLMSGTSVDGIDAALVSIPDHGPLTLKATEQQSFPPAVRNAIQALMLPGNNEIDQAGELDMQLGKLFAEAVHVLVRENGMVTKDIRAIGSHGQTIRHRPRALHPFTHQIGNPSVIAEQTGITTVADFRARDMAAGGEGAPLVPAFHRWFFQKAGVNRIILNIGGIANITWLPADAQEPVLGFDTGPGNTLLDQWIMQNRGERYDSDGEWAASGQVNAELLKHFLTDEYFSKAPPKSTGREHFHRAWLEQRLTGKLSAPDVQATLAELTTRSIIQALNFLPAKADEIYVCGGGSHNRYLLARLQGQAPNIPIATTAALGLDPDWVEAVAFAWLAHRTLAGETGNLPSVTGASHAVILGGIYPA